MNQTILLPVVQTKDPDLSLRFYDRVADLVPIATDDIRVLLAPRGSDRPALCLIDEVSQFVPRAARGLAGRAYLMLIVDNVEAAYNAALDIDAEVIEAPHGSGGRLRAIFRDPNGVVIDVTTAEGATTEKPLKHGA